MNMMDNRDPITSSFTSMLQEQGIELSERQLTQFHRYYELLVDWNTRMNLTAITDREQVYIKHFYDSVSLSFYYSLDQVRTMADIGAGAGFPGIPLKIVNPHLQLTIVDSLNKRIGFLQHVCKELQLEQVTCVHSRAEDAGRNPKLRDSFDMVTARAVARLPVLNELCLPFVRKDGMFAAMKGAQSDAEVAEAGPSLAALNGKLRETFRFNLPVEQGERNIVLIEKTGATPAKYPRKAGLPGKEPIL